MSCITKVKFSGFFFFQSSSKLFLIIKAKTNVFLTKHKRSMRTGTVLLGQFSRYAAHDIDVMALSPKPLISSKMIWKMPEKVATTQTLGTIAVSAKNKKTNKQTTTTTTQDIYNLLIVTCSICR